MIHENLIPILNIVEKTVKGTDVSTVLIFAHPSEVPEMMEGASLLNGPSDLISEMLARVTEEDPSFIYVLKEAILLAEKDPIKKAMISQAFSM